MEKIAITQGQMNLVLMAVEHGFRQCEKGNNLEAARASVFELYEVKSTRLTADHPMARAARTEDMPLA